MALPASSVDPCLRVKSRRAPAGRCEGGPSRRVRAQPFPRSGATPERRRLRSRRDCAIAEVAARVRAWRQEASMIAERASVCPLDCPDTCSLTVTVKTGAHRRGARLEGQSVYRGRALRQGARHYPDFVHGTGRLRHPLQRVGAKGEGRFERISWDEALDAIHDRFSAVIAAPRPAGDAAAQLRRARTACSQATRWSCASSTSWARRLLGRRPLCGGVRGEAWLGTFGAAPGIAAGAGRRRRSSSSYGATTSRSQPAPDAPHQRRPAQWRANWSSSIPSG